MYIAYAQIEMRLDDLDSLHHGRSDVRDDRYVRI